MMNQITEQLKLALTGGWFQGDFGFKKVFKKKTYGKAPYQFDWVDWLFSKLSDALKAIKEEWEINEIYSNGIKWYRGAIALSTAVTKRTKDQKKDLIMMHVYKAIARKAKARYEYRAKKWAWVMQ